MIPQEILEHIQQAEKEYPVAAAPPPPPPPPPPPAQAA